MSNYNKTHSKTNFASSKFASSSNKNKIKMCEYMSDWIIL